MHTFKVHKRASLREDILLDDSVREICYTSVSDWPNIHQWHKGIGRFPVPAEWKAWLRNDIYSGCFFSAFIVEEPTILIYKWPNKEQRWFLITRNGLLVESMNTEAWDCCFSFISKEEGGFLIRIEEDKTDTIEAEKLIYFPSQVNFTHFLIDSFAPVASLERLTWESLAETYALPLIGDQPKWQHEYLERLGFQKSNMTKDQKSNSFIVIRARAVAVPLFSNRPTAYLPLREFLLEGCGKFAERVDNRRGGEGIVMLTRRDRRRERIRNIEKIEAMVRSHGGLIVDPTKMSIEEKFQIFGSSNICIAEGSGATNAHVYGNSSCVTINLLDPKVMAKREFLVGGWPYLVHNSNRSIFVAGINGREVEGSPIGSAFYPEAEILEALMRSVSIG